MSQRGSTVFIDTIKAVSDESNVHIFTDNITHPTTFTSNDVGSLVISNDWNGITIDGGSSSPDICFGPDDASFTVMDIRNNDFVISMNNVSTPVLTVQQHGNVIIANNLSITQHVTSNTHGAMAVASNTYASPCVVTGTDTCGVITLTPTSNLYEVDVVVNFHTPYTVAPTIVVSSASRTFDTVYYYYAVATTTHFTFHTNVPRTEIAPFQRTSCSWNYIVIG